MIKTPHFQCKGPRFDPSVQFSSVTQSCPTLCHPMNCSTPGLPVHHQLPEFTQTHVHRVGDAIQPSHPLSSPFPSQALRFHMPRGAAKKGGKKGKTATLQTLHKRSPLWVLEAALPAHRNAVQEYISHQLLCSH